MNLGYRLFTLGVLAIVSSGVGTAAVFSFSGTFARDNEVQLFSFDIAAASTVILQTYGYGGGTNGNGQIISAGGFESVLGVYDAAGTAASGPIQPGPFAGCTADNLFCLDAFGQLSLGPGSYTVSLTQSPNDPLGDLSAGFFFVNAVPDPNFNSGFVGVFGRQRNGNWALDISGVDSATAQTATPEPATALLAAAALVLAGLGARKRS
jgi:uncharacterized protein (TIGR03382 family)